MPRIFDNIEKSLLPALKETLSIANRADFCVGYFNLRGWKQIDESIERWSGEDGHGCRLLVGMQISPREELEAGMGVDPETALMDTTTAARFARQMAEEFREQLTKGIPTADDERGLRRLAAQIRDGKLRMPNKTQRIW